MKFLESAFGVALYVVILAASIICFPLVLLVQGVDALIVWAEERKWK